MKGYKFGNFKTVIGWWSKVIGASMLPSIIWYIVIGGGDSIIAMLLSVAVYFYMAIHIGVKKYGIYGYKNWNAFSTPISLCFIGLSFSLMPATGFASILFVFPGIILGIVPTLILDKMYAKKMKAKLRGFVEDSGYNTDYYECDGNIFCAIDFSKPAIFFGSYSKNVEVKPSDIRAAQAATSERTIEAGSLPVTAKDNTIRIKTSIEGFEDLKITASRDDLEHGIFGSKLKQFVNLEAS